jgi:hypothetical protein
LLVVAVVVVEIVLHNCHPGVVVITLLCATLN